MTFRYRSLFRGIAPASLKRVLPYDRRGGRASLFRGIAPASLKQHDAGGWVSAYRRLFRGIAPASLKHVRALLGYRVLLGVSSGALPRPH